ncbi:hypothetical protein J1N35_011524 [Gossypium stocksii]|uniref:RNase H type-1 domain-containing protein n=1 Tax=Gossypium stocksii TaxID=47602 RepID=A0A9D3W2G6_9ROSI|nr:hypothetical protein J1N35_011524 [Gossypium stocksii]
MLVWKHEASGQYSVKSGYRALITDYMLTSSNNYYNVETYRDFYKFLWELHIPGKIKIHAWRAINNYVPHNINLSQRLLVVDVVCPLFSWSHENMKSFPMSMKQPLWRPPIGEMIKLNFDASFLRESRTLVAAIIARNSEGNFMGACTYNFGNVVDATIVEARACERAMVFATELGCKRIMVEGDSLITIKKLNSKEEDRSVLKSIISSIRDMEKQFDYVLYLFVPRLANRAAHALALEGRRSQYDGYWSHEPLESVKLVLEADWRNGAQRC